MSFNLIVDRIAVLSSTIHEKASQSSQPASNYVDAILSQPLASYVREADIVESRMFVVSQPPPGEISTAVDLKRKEAVSASPLKKARDAPLALLEPEAYIRSVIRLGEKYDVMPRAQAYARKLLEQTEQLQKSIPELEHMLKEGSTSASASAPGSAIRKKMRTLQDEERLTREAEARAATLREQRNILIKRLNTMKDSANTSASDVSVFTSPSTMRSGLDSAPLVNLMEKDSSTAQIPLKKLTTAQEMQARRQARQAARKAKQSQPSDVPKPSASSALAKESAFWSGEGTPPSTSSFVRTLDSATESGSSTVRSGTHTDEDDQSTPETQQTSDVIASDIDVDVDTETGEDDGDGDVTIVLQSKEQAPAQSRRTFSLLRHSSAARATMTPGRLSAANVRLGIPTPPPPLPEVSSSMPDVPPAIPVESGQSIPQHSPKVTSSTLQSSLESRHATGEALATLVASSGFDVTSPEVELQMARVWRTVGELIIPENSYTKNGTSPKAETTFKILSAIAELPTKTHDPTGSAADATLSMLNNHRPPSATASLLPSAVQVLTACAILTLLSYVVENAAAPGEDGFIWMPQNALKAEMKNNSWAAEGVANERVDWVTRTMVKLVPSKMIVLDRKKGVVRFGRD